MNRIYAKLIVISLALTLSVAVVVMSSYAWLVLSSSPAVSGIQVAIGGGNTILVAADMTQTVDGVTYHYPDAFSDKLNFGQHESYTYLKSLGGLTPVSTADGVNWFLPAYYDATDEEVQEGIIPNGQLRDIEDFTLDNTLSHANLTADDEDAVKEGNYIFLDFWVVSPGSDYTLRISTGDDSGGSFVMDLLEAGTDGTGHTLSSPENEAAAAARVGFLVNSNRIMDDTMLYYQNTEGFDERYTQLRGSYREAQSGVSYDNSSRFMIYEPNGDYHPEDTAPAGSYVPTLPITMVNGTPTEVSVMNLVTVQKKTDWLKAADADQLAIEQIFQTSIFGKDLTGMETEEISEAFYSTYLQGQIAPYVDKTEDKGDFYKKTSDLAKYNGLVTADELAQLDTAGATDDVYIIELERNVPQRIRMFIWLEGQDVDCVNSVSASSFAVNIELAGSTE